MKLKNFQLQGLYNFLYSLELSGRNSRMRTRFCKFIKQQIDTIESERMILVRELADKNEDGTLKVTKDENNPNKDILHFSDDNASKYNIEYITMMNEPFVIDETDEREDMIVTVASIVLNTDKLFSKEEAEEYDYWCDLFENLSYYNK